MLALAGGTSVSRAPGRRCARWSRSFPTTCHGWTEVTMSPRRPRRGPRPVACNRTACSRWLPAWRLGRTDPQATLHATRRSVTEGGGAARVRRLLVTGEVALSTVLVAVAALLDRELRPPRSCGPRFTVSDALFADVRWPALRSPIAARRLQFFDRLLAPGARACPARPRWHWCHNGRSAAKRRSRRWSTSTAR